MNFDKKKAKDLFIGIIIGVIIFRVSYWVASSIVSSYQWFPAWQGIAEKIAAFRQTITLVAIINLIINALLYRRSFWLGFGMSIGLIFTIAILDKFILILLFF